MQRDRDNVAEGLAGRYLSIKIGNSTISQLHFSLSVVSYPKSYRIISPFCITFEIKLYVAHIDNSIVNTVVSLLVVNGEKNMNQNTVFSKNVPIE